MQKLDSARWPFARLVVSSHVMPFRGGWFGQNPEHPGYERVDLFDGHTQMLLAGGSIELAEPPAPAPEPTAPAKSE